jgi:DNA-binding NtrC family response regulator
VTDRPRRGRLLPVEDDAEVAAALVALLADAHSDIALAATAEEGLALVPTCRAGVGLLDMSRPGLSGPRLLAVSGAPTRGEPAQTCKETRQLTMLGIFA